MGKEGTVKTTAMSKHEYCSNEFLVTPHFNFPWITSDSSETTLHKHSRASLCLLMQMYQFILEITFKSRLY